MTVTDEDYAARLRSHVRLDELHSGLAPERVLATSRRKRRARVTGGASLGVAVLLGAGVVATLAGPGRDAQAVPPAGGEVAATTVEVAPGVRAVETPGERVLADGTTAVLLGLEAANVSAPGTEVAVVPDDGSAAGAPPAPWLDRTLEIALLDGDVLSQRQHWARYVTVAPLTEREAAYWTRGGAPEPTVHDPRLVRGTPPGLAPDEGWALGMVFDDGTWLVVGLAPAGADPGARAEVHLREPVPGPDGASLPALQLPTFDVGSADGRRMFAATVAPGVGPGQPSAEDGPVLLERIPVRVAHP